MPLVVFVPVSFTSDSSPPQATLWCTGRVGLFFTGFSLIHLCFYEEGKLCNLCVITNWNKLQIVLFSDVFHRPLSLPQEWVVLQTYVVVVVMACCVVRVERTKGLVQMFSPKYKKSSCLVGKKKDRKLTTTRCCR